MITLVLFYTNVEKNENILLFWLIYWLYNKTTRYNILCFSGLFYKVVIPTGLEPISKEPESFILSIELGDHISEYKANQIFKKREQFAPFFNV